MRKRKPILFIDDGANSKRAMNLFEKENLSYVVYYVKKFEECNCDKIPVTVVPSVFAPEGIFKEFEGIKKYVREQKTRETSTS